MYQLLLENKQNEDATIEETENYSDDSLAQEVDLPNFYGEFRKTDDYEIYHYSTDSE